MPHRSLLFTPQISAYAKCKLDNRPNKSLSQIFSTTEFISFRVTGRSSSEVFVCESKSNGVALRVCTGTRSSCHMIAYSSPSRSDPLI
ncbi:unnamed protein product [Rotaria sp. Silwood1]|nr:unnamed protein product [Rotaria sp. Silwood1]